MAKGVGLHPEWLEAHRRVQPTRRVRPLDDGDREAVDIGPCMGLPDEILEQPPPNAPAARFRSDVEPPDDRLVARLLLVLLHAAGGANEHVVDEPPDHHPPDWRSHRPEPLCDDLDREGQIFVVRGAERLGRLAEAAEPQVLVALGVARAKRLDLDRRHTRRGGGGRSRLWATTAA